jgi:hypothetical protein
MSCIKCGQCCLNLGFTDKDSPKVREFVKARGGRIIKSDGFSIFYIIPQRCASLQGNKPGEYKCSRKPKPARCQEFPAPGEILLPGCGYNKNKNPERIEVLTNE